MHHLYEQASSFEGTLPKNLLDNEDYDNLQFVLLDYNSSDGESKAFKQGAVDIIADVWFNLRKPELAWLNDWCMFFESLSYKKKFLNVVFLDVTI